MLEANPLLMLAVEGFGVRIWKRLGVPLLAQTCPLSALFSKCSAVLDVDSCPILHPVPSLSYHSQCRCI